MPKGVRTTQVFKGNPGFLCCAPQTMLNNLQLNNLQFLQHFQVQFSQP